MVRRSIGVLVVMGAIGSAMGDHICYPSDDDPYVLSGYTHNCIELPPEYEYPFVQIYDMNNMGHVVGYVRDDSNGGLPARSFMWDPSSGFHYIEHTHISAQPFALNERGEVVGQYYDGQHPDDKFESFGGAFVWDLEGGFREIGPVGERTDAIALGINDIGIIVGALDLFQGGDAVGSLYSNTDGQYLQPPDIDDPQVPWRINNSGLIAGTDEYRPARWTLGGPSELIELPPDATFASSWGIAEDGSVLVLYDDGTPGFSLNLAVALIDGRTVDLGPISEDGRAFDMNSLGDVVFESRDDRLMLWSRDSGLREIPTEGSTFFGDAYKLQINDSGVIAVSFYDRFFTLTPIPTPASIALLGCAIPIVLRRAR